MGVGGSPAFPGPWVPAVLRGPRWQRGFLAARVWRQAAGAVGVWSPRRGRSQPVLQQALVSRGRADEKAEGEQRVGEKKNKLKRGQKGRARKPLEPLAGARPGPLRRRGRGRGQSACVCASPPPRARREAAPAPGPASSARPWGPGLDGRGRDVAFEDLAAEWGPVRPLWQDLAKGQSSLDRDPVSGGFQVGRSRRSSAVRCQGRSGGGSVHSGGRAEGPRGQGLRMESWLVRWRGLLGGSRPTWRWGRDYDLLLLEGSPGRPGRSCCCSLPGQEVLRTSSGDGPEMEAWHGGQSWGSSGAGRGVE